MKLWKVTVNDWGWDSAHTYYFKSREEAKEFSDKYPASDGVKYAGNFTEKSAEQILYGDDVDWRVAHYGY